ncbi:MAG TPA: multidrug efflux RND transporter permease subunit [Gammaproteobacteria bacterium]|nr:multidrug efflux RND transporter permease subunit [Gammaproteobacteria bacterium]
MQFTDLFIKRPVLATVVSLLIFIFGLRAIHDLPLREYPAMKNTVITVTTSYPGASAEVVQGFVTSILEKSIAGADGIDYMTATSNQGVSTIQVYIKLNYDPNAAFTDIMSKVSEVQGQLPTESKQPTITKATGSTIALMYISYFSKEMSPQQITEFISRVVRPKLQTVSGVSSIDILGGNTFAMRIWLNPQRMAALQISPDDIATALKQNNFQSAAGKTKGEYVAFNINAITDIHDVDTFKDMVVKNNGSTLIRIRDVAEVELGSESYDSLVTFNGQKAIFIGINATPDANPLTVIKDVRKLLPDLRKISPPALQSEVVYDSTRYISASIHDVIKTIIEATIIVIVVIFLFLGSLRSVAIPVVTIPLSLVGVCTLMLGLGYSLNLLTLLAMVLAIGLVVDDAIVVVENIHRHIEEGLTPFAAALQGAREIAGPVIAMTITLAAVYAPIGFMSGLTGALFKEFAFTLASAVIISGIIALTLSPMMCSKVLRSELAETRFARFLDQKFDRLKLFYQRRLNSTLNFRPVVVVFAIIVLTSCYFLYRNTKQELAPTEDQSVLFAQATAPQYANLDYLSTYTNEFNKIYASFPETAGYFVINGGDDPTVAFSGIILKPWAERSRSQQKINPLLQAKIKDVPGVQAAVFPLPSLPTGGNPLPIQFVINSTESYELVYQISQKIVEAARKSGNFIFIDNSLKFNKPELQVNIDRNKAGQLGISMQDIGQALATSLGGNYINVFSMQGQSYEVIPQILRELRLNPDQIANIYVKAGNGQMVPLSTVVNITSATRPNNLTEFQQQNSSTIQGMLIPGKTIGDGLKYLKDQAEKFMPKGMSYDYAGQSRQYIQESSALIYTFFFALIVIFLVLAAQFESFRDPLIILISVPMSICGALIPLNLGLASINIYTQVGLITLIGLISKHGILMVDFANHLQETEGLSKREAIEKAAGIRLRPILMTTGAMILGVVPLIIATGAGAVSRFDIGLVIATGMLIGTLFTLFVVPTMYTFFAKNRNKNT